MVSPVHVRMVYEYLSGTAVPRGRPATYEQICDILGLSLDEAYNYIRYVLDDIFVACDQRRLPPLTSIVVGVNTMTADGRHGMPGSGYFVAEAVSPNHAGCIRHPGIEMFHPDAGLSIDEKDALARRSDFRAMVYAHQDLVWNYRVWPERLQ